MKRLSRRASSEFPDRRATGATYYDQSATWMGKEFTGSEPLCFHAQKA
jgi:hypothetical protein